MLRITTDADGDESLLVSLAGRLTLDSCNEVDEVLREAEIRGLKAAVDLAGIRLVDRGSVEYLAGLRRRQIRLTNLPPYVRRWVDQVFRGPESEI